MHQLIPAAPRPHGLLRGICPPHHSRGWGICKFCAAREPGIYLPTPGLFPSFLHVRGFLSENPTNSENKPRGLYFSKALFEGLIFGGTYIWRGLSTEGNLRFKIDWASPIVGRKFTVLDLFYFVFEGNFPSTTPGGLYSEGRLNGRFFVLPVWGAYIWRGLFSEFYGITTQAI